MALIICPDCKNEVSDTAEMCVNCGCDLFLYKESVRIDKEIEKKIKEYEQSIKMPEKYNSISEIPSHRGEAEAYMLMLLVGIGMCITGFCICFAGVEAIMGGIFVALMGIGFIMWSSKGKKNAKEALEKENERIQYTIDNFEEQKKQKIEFLRKTYEKQKKQELDKIRERKTKIREEEPKGVHCPMCKATEYDKISTLNRMVSVELVGIASSKIGKQYKCKKCGHMW